MIPKVKTWTIILYQNNRELDRCEVQSPTRFLAKLKVLHDSPVWRVAKGPYWNAAYTADRMTITIKRV